MIECLGNFFLNGAGSFLLQIIAKNKTIWKYAHFQIYFLYIYIYIAISEASESLKHRKQ